MIVPQTLQLPPQFVYPHRLVPAPPLRRDFCTYLLFIHGVRLLMHVLLIAAVAPLRPGGREVNP